MDLYQDGKIFNFAEKALDLEGFENKVSLTVDVPREYKDKYYEVKAYVLEIVNQQTSALSTVAAKSITPLNIENKAAPNTVAIESGSIYGASQQTGLAYVLRLDPDRLLAPCYQAVGRGDEAKNERYGGWEGQQIAGHSLGHYLSALADFYAATKDSQIKERMDYVIEELSRIQREDGFLAGVESTPFDTAFTGDFTVDAFGLSGYWVPWYSIHKIYAGLIDAYKIGGSRAALGIVKKMADWAINGSKNMTEDQFQKMLLCEHGGMSEVMADLYGITKEDIWLWPRGLRRKVF